MEQYGASPVGRRRVVVTRGRQLLVDGCPIFEGTKHDFDDAVLGLVGSEAVHLVVTPNVDQVLLLQEDSEWARVFSWASLRVIDGVPLLWLSRLIGAKSAHKHSGSDLVPQLSALADRNGLRVAIVGGRPEVLQEAVARLRREFQGAHFEPIPFPHVAEAGDPLAAGVVADLKRARPDIVFVCLGAPKQEKWVHLRAHELPPAVYLGVGAAIDFAAGAKVRAPRVVTAVGLEWFWRFAQEPRRLWSRYFVRGPRFLLVFADSLRGALRSNVS